MTGRATLKDVAALAGTSTSTASRVISGVGLVAPETRARVLEAMKALNYHPNLRARGLRQRSSRNIGLVIPNLLNAYYTALADTIVTLLGKRRYHLLLASTQDDVENEQDTIYDMVGQAVDGLIWVPSAPSATLLEYLQDQQIPVVSIVRCVPNAALDTVVFEDFDGAYAATQHLLNLGHRRIGYVGGNVRHSSNHARWQGNLAALRDNDVPVDASLYKLGSPISMWGSVATVDLLQLRQPPTALFVASNALMPGVIKTLRQHQVHLPDDLSLICFDDIDWFSLSVPPITAVSVSQTRLAEAALDLLMRRIEAADGATNPPTHMEISFELVVRGSTAPVHRQTPVSAGNDGHVVKEEHHA